jgi:hypothetical protein
MARLVSFWGGFLTAFPAGIDAGPYHHHIAKSRRLRAVIRADVIVKGSRFLGAPPVFGGRRVERVAARCAMLSRAAVAILTPSQPRESICPARVLMLSRGSDRREPLKPARESMAHLSFADDKGKSPYLPPSKIGGDAPALGSIIVWRRGLARAPSPFYTNRRGFYRIA